MIPVLDFRFDNNVSKIIGWTDDQQTEITILSGNGDFYWNGLRRKYKHLIMKDGQATISMNDFCLWFYEKFGILKEYKDRNLVQREVQFRYRNGVRPEELQGRVIIKGSDGKFQVGPQSSAFFNLRIATKKEIKAYYKAEEKRRNPNLKTFFEKHPLLAGIIIGLSGNLPLATIEIWKAYHASH